jgi:hypothetical protein
VLATFYGLPLSYPDEVSAAQTPHLFDWLRRCHARRGLQEAFPMSRGVIAQRAADVRELLGVAMVAA